MSCLFKQNCNPLKINILINGIFYLVVLKRKFERINLDVGRVQLSFPIIFLLLLVNCSALTAQNLPGFRASGTFGEQQLVLENNPSETRILINAPLNGFGKKDRVLLVFFALPNGNTIEQTVGKNLQAGDDWHFNIQHIGAQTRFLRHQIKNRTIVTVYVESRQKKLACLGGQHQRFR